jgi:hypothetical protein
LIAVKTSKQSISAPLYYFQKQTSAPFAFQVTKNMEFVDLDCFENEGIFIVSAKNFLSQLV